MRVGQLRQSLVLQSATKAVDSVGESIKTWANLSTNPTVWGRAVYLSGRELEAAQKINSDIQMEFTIRHRADITTKNRVVWNSKNWNIGAVLPDERKTMVRLLASEQK
jgi:SPP1 family predicted phage head-tail adaptor